MPGAAANFVSAYDLRDPEDPRLSESALRAARDAGFGALLWRDRHRPDEPAPELAALARKCEKAGLRLFVETDPARFPIDHPLVERHPEAFSMRRGMRRDAPVDPRESRPAIGEARARLRADEAAEVLTDLLQERLLGLVERGAGGFRLPDAERMSEPLLDDLLARLRDRSPDLQFLAGPVGDRSAATRKLDRFDFLVSSFGWWDGRTPWLAEEFDELRAAAALLCELDGDDHQCRWNAHGDLNGRLEAAAALGSGFILPIGSLADREARPALDRASDLIALTERFSGETRRLSATAAPVTAILRAAGPDLRHADEAMLVLINTSQEPQAPPPFARLAQAGADFTPWVALDPGGDSAGLLEPGETRVLAARRAAPVALRSPAPAAPSRQAARLVVEDIVPGVDGGDFPAKRVVGDLVQVEATIFADGHEHLGAELRWRALDAKEWNRAPMAQLANDHWRAAFPLERLGRHEFVVEGWLDRFGGFRRDFAKKLAADVAQPVDHAEGRVLVAEAVTRCKGKARTALKNWHDRLERADEEDSAVLLLDDGLAALMAAADDRPHRLTSKRRLVDAERLEARFSSWYELFPRSQTDDPDRHGTFDDVIERLPAVRAMGFDTLYFPPIHPIGKANRKGPNNTLTPGPDDPGSPYAIGSPEGGHDAIHPELGTFADFDRLVAAARDHGLEIALDFAIQASPDHPWLKEHPGWFAWRPDGSMKYAENPPKKYQDIVNVDFYGPDAVPALWEALRDVILLWIDHGVKTFRVDNPHTKPLPFWEWMIADVRARHPDAIFLSEAFTRPTMMYRLAKIGFSQSYTYFTWRDRKQELTDYIVELTTEAPKDFYRPHFFVNTPDINPHFLQTSGRPGFRIRAVLAATLSGLWGVYSGFELCDGTPLAPGKEEYLDSEKYEIRVRDWNAPGNIIADITLLNRLRRSHPALQTHLNTRFYTAHDDNIIWYGKPSPDRSEMIMVMVNLDPHGTHACDFEVPLWEFGLPDHASIAVEDLAAGHRFDWHGKTQHIVLAPDEPYRIWRLSPHGAAA